MCLKISKREGFALNINSIDLSKVSLKKKHNKFNNFTFTENLELFLLLTPALAYYIIFHYLPMFGAIIAFKNFKYDLGILASPWTGFDNFKFFFLSQDAWLITRNTVGYGLLFIFTNIVTGVLVALLLYEVSRRAYVKIYQTAMILPHFMSWVVVGYIVYAFLDPINGVVNRALSCFGLNQISWYAESTIWPFIITFVHIWKAVGMGSVVYYAALMGIDPSLFEAAVLDGANKFQQIRYISIPCLKPLMTILAILSIGNIFRGDFGLFFQIPMDVGALYPVTDIIDTYLYRGLRTGDISVTAAVGLFQSVVGLILVLTTNMIVKRINPENSLF